MNLIEMAEKASLRAAETAKRFGVEALFLNAPMRQAAGVEMTAAVSEAGGLGVLAAAHLSPEKIVQAAQAIRNRTEKPFAVSLAIRPRHYPQAQGAETLFDGLAPLLEDLGLACTPEAYDLTGSTVFPAFDEQFEAALSVAPQAMISTFGGFREPEAEKLEAKGILNFGCATTLKEAKVLRSAGVDAIVIQGAAAGGPRWSFENADDVLVATEGLVEEAARATGLPIIAAGGLASSASFASALLAGASGVMLGTALLTTEESRMTDTARSAWHWAGAADLVLSRAFCGRLERVLRSPMTEALESYDSSVPAWPAPLALFLPIWEKAAEQGRDELFVLPAGQGIGRSHWRTVREALAAYAALIGR